MGKITPSFLERLLRRDEQAWREFVGIVAPIVQARGTRLLLSRGASRHRDIREEVKDLIQKICHALLVDDCRLLRWWNADRGMPFESFVGRIAEQQAAAMFRGSGWREELVDPNDLDLGRDSSSTPEEIVASTEVLNAILQKLQAEFTDRDLLLFQLHCVERRWVDEVARIIGMSEAAVYQWRSRLWRRIEEIARELGCDEGMAPVGKGKKVG